MNSKNRNDVTYFLKIEAYVILMCLIFFFWISLPYINLIYLIIFYLVGKWKKE